MALVGVRWRTVVPLTVAVLTFFAARNLVTVVMQSPDDSDVLSQLTINGRSPYAAQEPPTGNDVVRDVRRKSNRAALGNVMRLFAEDDDDANRIDTDVNHQMEKKALEEANANEEEPKPVELFLVAEDGGDTLRSDFGEHVSNRSADVNLPLFDPLQPQLGFDRSNFDRKRKLDDEQLLQQKQLQEKRGNGSAPVDKDALLMMANMGEVGAIVRQIKQEQQEPADSDKSGRRNQTTRSEQRPLANPHPFNYVINSPKICSDVDESLFAIVYIHTAPDHYKRRTIIRQTWGDVKRYDVTVRLVFVMGLAVAKNGSESNAIERTQSAVMFEAEQYGDIVQEDFADTYHNLTYKGIAALRWIDIHCRNAVFVIKTDDDIFVNMYSLLRYLKRVQRNAVNARPKDLIMCCVWDGMPVLREGKWKVTKEEWPEDFYPTYCSGAAFIMSTDLAIAMHRISYNVPFFWVDDFYISGLLPLRLGNIKHRSFGSAYVMNGDQLEEKFTGPQWYTYVFSEVHNLDRIQAVWDTLVQLATGQIKAHIQTRTVGRKSRSRQ